MHWLGRVLIKGSEQERTGKSVKGLSIQKKIYSPSIYLNLWAILPYIRVRVCSQLYENTVAYKRGGPI